MAQKSKDSEGSKFLKYYVSQNIEKSPNKSTPLQNKFKRNSSKSKLLLKSSMMNNIDNQLSRNDIVLPFLDNKNIESKKAIKSCMRKMKESALSR